MFFYTLLGYLLEPLERLASVNLKLQDALVAVDRLYQVMDLEPEPLATARRPTFTGRPRGHRAPRGRLPLRLPARDVLERTEPADPGRQDRGDRRRERLGQVDPAQAPDGLLRAHRGRILIDGVDLRDSSWRRCAARIGLVSQDPFIFNGNVRGEHRPGPAGCDPGGDRRGGPRRRTRRSSSRGCPSGTRRSSANGRRTCRAASGSGWRSRGPCCGSRRS